METRICFIVMAIFFLLLVRLRFVYFVDEFNCEKVGSCDCLIVFDVSYCVYVAILLARFIVQAKLSWRQIDYALATRTRRELKVKQRAISAVFGSLILATTIVVILSLVND